MLKESGYSVVRLILPFFGMTHSCSGLCQNLEIKPMGRASIVYKELLKN